MRKSHIALCFLFLLLSFRLGSGAGSPVQVPGPKWHTFSRKDCRRQPWIRDRALVTFNPFEAVTVCMTFLNLLERKLFTHDSPGNSWMTEFEPDPICIPVAEQGEPVDNRISNHCSAEHTTSTVWNGMLTEDVPAVTQKSYNCATPFTNNAINPGQTAQSQTADDDVRKVGRDGLFGTSGAVPSDSHRHHFQLHNGWVDHACQIPDFAASAIDSVCWNFRPQHSFKWEEVDLDDYERSWFPNVSSLQNEAHGLHDMTENLNKRKASNSLVSAIEAVNFEGSFPCEFSSSCSVQSRTSRVANTAPGCVTDMRPHNSSWECLVGHICGFHKLINQRSPASRLRLDYFHARTAHTHICVNQLSRTGSARVQDSHNLLWCSPLIAVSALAFVICAIPSAAADGTNDSPASQIPTFRIFDFLQSHPWSIIFLFSIILLSSSLCLMIPSNPNILRTPPGWGPEQESTYPFRQWSRDILLWSIASDMDPARKAASVMLVLRGAAKELARQIPPQAVVRGGLVNGVAVDPLTFLMHSLQERFGNLGEEVRVQAITELMSFHRRGHEPIDALLVRFDSIRTRAAEQGGAIVSIQGVTWILLRAIGVSDTQLIQLLMPFQGLFPATEAELTQLKTALRRMGHILERAPGNLRENLRTGTAAAFLTQEQWEPEQQNYHNTWNPQSAFTAYEHIASEAPAGSPGWANPTEAYAAHEYQPSHESATAFYEEDIETDSATSSGSDVSEVQETGDANRIAQELFWAYRNAKAKWRKFMGKTTRAVRRHVHRFQRRKGKGKGKPSHNTFVSGKGKTPTGKGKGGNYAVAALLAEMTDAQIESFMPAFRGRRSPGKGKGRRGNPRGPDGQIMRCHECDSTEHLVGNCPRRAGRQHSTAAPPTSTHFFTELATEGPLAGIMNNVLFARTVDSQEGVTFASNENDPLLRNVAQQFMVTEARPEEAETVTGQDPLQQHDPWSSATTRSWSVPSSRPVSYGPMQFARQFTRNLIGSSRTLPHGPETQSEPTYQPMQQDHPSVPASQQTANMPTPVAEATRENEGLPPTMNWASMANMPDDLRNLLPWPVIPYHAPSVPGFAELPEFEFLNNPNQPRPDIVRPRTLIDPQPSTLEQPFRSQLDDFFFVQQHVSYSRNQTGVRPMNRPDIQVHSQLDPQYRPQLHDFHHTQGQVERMRRQRRQCSAQPSHNIADAEYDGASNICALCRECYEPGESVLRLACKHVYHVSCWSDLLMYGDHIQCPVCRGGGHIIARFRVPYEELPNEPVPDLSRPVTPSRTRSTPEAEVFNIFTPPPARRHASPGQASAGTPFLSPIEQPAADLFPWWPGEDDDNRREQQSASAAPVYHSISIPNRAGIIIDPGAYTNLIGENTARMFAQLAVNHGYEPKQWKIKPMYIQGVGNGQQSCEWMISIPIACQLSINSLACCVNYFQAPVVGGTGARLPALLGLKSLSALSTTLCMVEGKEALQVPVDPLSSDLSHCRTCPLAKAPSGHLIMTIDHWDELHANTKRGIAPEPIVLHMSRPEAAASSSL